MTKIFRPPPPDFPNRRSIRLSGYDYTQPGAYFITFCTYQMRHTLGRVENGRSVLSPLGEIVREEWFRTAELRPYIHVDDDEFMIMPHHGHGVIWQLDEDGKPVLSSMQFDNPAPMPGRIPLGSVIGQFKAAVTKRLNRLTGRAARVWHRGYWERIIRDEVELERTRRYIRNNPSKWGKLRLRRKEWGKRVGGRY